MQIKQRVKKYLILRLPSVYRRLLKYKWLYAAAKPSSGLTVVMMVGKNYLELLRISVYAIAKNWKELPRLIIINDGTVDDATIKKQLRFWRGEMIIQHWENSSDYHALKGRQALVTFAKSHPFGKKMSVIMHHAEFGPVLWVDSDILFYKDPKEYLPVSEDDFVCGGTEDWFRAYDPDILKILPENRLHLNQGMNAGLLYLKGKNVYENFGIEQLLAKVHPNYVFFTEQTLFAYIADRSMGILWKQSIVKNSQDDNQQLRVKNQAGMMARHYTSIMRPLFWRDAMLNL